MDTTEYKVILKDKEGRTSYTTIWSYNQDILKIRENSIKCLVDKDKLTPVKIIWVCKNETIWKLQTEACVCEDCYRKIKKASPKWRELILLTWREEDECDMCNGRFKLDIE